MRRGGAGVPPAPEAGYRTAMILRLAEFLPYRLSIASNAVSKLIAKAYAEISGLSIPEWRVIAVLQEVGSAPQHEIVRRTLMDKVAVSRAAQSLAQRGLIDRVEDSGDARARRLSLTDAGQRLYQRIAPTALDYERRLLAAFSEAEIAQAHALLERLEQAAQDIAQEEEGRSARGSAGAEPER